MHWRGRYSVLLVALLLAGCSTERDPSGQGAGTVPARTGTARIVFIGHSNPRLRPFWAVVRNGAEAAARDQRVRVELEFVETPDDMTEMAARIDAAVSSDPDGIAVSVPDVASLGAPVRAAVEAGIPVVVYNAGSGDFAAMGALTYVGEVSLESGKRVGERLLADGARYVLCAKPDAANKSTADRCAGVASTPGLDVTTIATDTVDPEVVRRELAAALDSDVGVDTLVMATRFSGEAALPLVRRVASERGLRFATYDLSPEILSATRAGEVSFAVDQQPWLQGYLPVLYLAQYKRYGLMPAGAVVSTGPLFVTRDDAAIVEELAREGVR